MVTLKPRDVLGEMKPLALKGEAYLCAACDKIVGEAHPPEWMCSNEACGIWHHERKCPRCGSEPLE